jgi:hypothetical protein
MHKKYTERVFKSLNIILEQFLRITIQNFKYVHIFNL